MKKVNFCLFVVIISFFCSQAVASEFREEWKNAQVKSYKPQTDIKGDTGTWSIGDTISWFPEDCGETPHTAEILGVGEQHILRLNSVDSKSDCADNIWAANDGLKVPITPDTRISFAESGDLGFALAALPVEGAEFSRPNAWACRNPPCYAAALMLVDEGQTPNVILSYIFQRDSDATPNTLYDHYREIFLDPASGVYDRNLFDDFSSIPDFNPSNANITTIEFTIDIPGWAELDYLLINTQSGCKKDDDCDDGVFCNGAEECIAGECVSGIEPCDEAETCDEASNQCFPEGDDEWDLNGDGDVDKEDSTILKLQQKVEKTDLKVQHKAEQDALKAAMGSSVDCGSGWDLDGDCDVDKDDAKLLKLRQKDEKTSKKEQHKTEKEAMKAAL